MLLAPLAGRNSFGRDGLVLPHRASSVPAFPASTPHLALDILKTRRHALQDPLHPHPRLSRNLVSDPPLSLPRQSIACLPHASFIAGPSAGARARPSMETKQNASLPMKISVGRRI
jgi:hypothetical protein